MMPLVDPFPDVGNQAPIVTRQQTRQQQLKSDQQEMQARGINMARTGQEISNAAALTPLDIALKKQQLLKAQQVTSPKLSDMDVKTLQDLRQKYDAASSLADNANQFGAMNSRTPTGGLYAVPGMLPVLKATGLASQDISDMDRIGTQMATQMRPQNSRLTQGEFTRFTGVSPSVKSDESQNKPIVNNLNTQRTMAAAQNAFAQAYAQKNGTTLGLDNAWTQWRTQHFSPDGTVYYHDGAPPATKDGLPDGTSYLGVIGQ